MKKYLNLLLLTVCVNIILAPSSYGQIDGKMLFTQNCTACHTIGSGQLVGPDLIGVNDKYEEEWLLKFIRSSQALVTAGDERAVAVFQQFSMIPMPDQPFDDEEIRAMLAHIESYDDQSNETVITSENATQDTEEAKIIAPEDANTNWLSGNNPYILIIFGLEFMLIAVLITIAIVLIGIKKIL